MIKCSISRVMLTGVVGMVVVTFLAAGCSIKDTMNKVASAKVEAAVGMCAGQDHEGVNELFDCEAVKEADTYILEGGLLETETAVDAYTEEPRWEGATDYSQACSSSSGDLGC